MGAETQRRPSPLQRSILIVLAALDELTPGPVATREIERLLEQGGDKPVYGNNLRESCKRMERAGLVRTLRAPNLQLAIELTSAGRAAAAPLLAAERDAETAHQRATAVIVLPLVNAEKPSDQVDQLVELQGVWYIACRADFVVRLDGSTCLQLWRTDGAVQRMEGDPVQIATWSQACHNAGINVRVQVNESHSLNNGTPATKGGVFPQARQAKTLTTWCQSLSNDLMQLEIWGAGSAVLSKTIAYPTHHLRPLTAPQRFLEVMAMQRPPQHLHCTVFEADIQPTLTTLLQRYRFSPAQTQEFVNLVSWPLKTDNEVEPQK